MISVHVGCIETFPSVYIKGEVVCSDQTWQVSDYAGSPVQAGYSRYFTDEKQNPAVWEYSEKICLPVSVEEREDGLLYEFETELTAVLEIHDRKAGRTLRAYCGESREEALDRERCYYSWLPDPETGRCPRCALRYVFVAEEGKAAPDGNMADDIGITTPYFKFYEMDALCRMGYLEEVLKRIREYWGGMLERGAVTFWEEYDPAVPESEQYDMYGDKFGKSLCHAWSASPIYLLARYFVGLEITDPARGVYELHPHLEYFESLGCVLPVGDKDIHIVWDGKELTCEQAR